MKSIYLALILFSSIFLLSKCSPNLVPNQSDESNSDSVSLSPTSVDIIEESPPSTEMDDSELLRQLELDDIDIDAEFRSLELELSQ